MFHVEQGKRPNDPLRRYAPAPPRGRLCAMPETLSPPLKAVPLGKVASPQAMTEGVTSAQVHFALQPETLLPCQRPHPRGGCLRSRLGKFRQIPPQSLRDSSPKGTPLRYAGNFIATAKSRPLGEGGIAAGDDGRGDLRSGALCTSARNFPAMPRAPPSGELASRSDD